MFSCETVPGLYGLLFPQHALLSTINSWIRKRRYTVYCCLLWESLREEQGCVQLGKTRTGHQYRAIPGRTDESGRKLERGEDFPSKVKVEDCTKRKSRRQYRQAWRSRYMCSTLERRSVQLQRSLISLRPGPCAAKSAQPCHGTSCILAFTPLLSNTSPLQKSQSPSRYPAADLGLVRVAS